MARERGIDVEKETKTDMSDDETKKDETTEETLQDEDAQAAGPVAEEALVLASCGEEPLRATRGDARGCRRRGVR